MILTLIKPVMHENGSVPYQILHPTLTHSCLKQPEPPDYFGDISQTKEFFRNYLEKIMINLNVTWQVWLQESCNLRKVDGHVKTGKR